MQVCIFARFLPTPHLQQLTIAIFDLKAARIGAFSTDAIAMEQQSKVTTRSWTTRQDEEFPQGVHDFHASLENERSTTAMGIRPALMSHVAHDPVAQSRESVLDMPLESECCDGYENLNTSQFMASVDSNIPEQRLSPISLGDFFQDTPPAFSSSNKESVSPRPNET